MIYFEVNIKTCVVHAVDSLLDHAGRKVVGRRERQSKRDCLFSMGIRCSNPSGQWMTRRCSKAFVEKLPEASGWESVKSKIGFDIVDWSTV